MVRRRALVLALVLASSSPAVQHAAAQQATAQPRPASANTARPPVMRPAGRVRLLGLVQVAKTGASGTAAEASAAGAGALRARVVRAIRELQPVLVTCYQKSLDSAEPPPAQRLAVRFDVLADGTTAVVAVTAPENLSAARHCFEHAFARLPLARAGSALRPARYRASFELSPGPLQPVRMIQ